MRAAALLVSMVLAGCASQPPGPPTPPTPASAPQEDAAPPPSTGIVRREDTEVTVEGLPMPEAALLPKLPVEGPIRIKAVGDIMLGTDYPEDRLPGDDGTAQLAQVAALLADADLTFGNLEGALADGLPPVKTCSDPASCYLFRTPTRFVAALKAAGFDVMSLANNHARDFGEDGRDSSIQALRWASIRQSGREEDVARWVAAGRQVALIAFAPNPGNHSLLDVAGAAAEVRALAATHDLVIVSFHGGGEGADRTRVVRGMETFRGEPRGDLIAFSHAVIDAGADLVIGHGPHVPRALELYQGRLIAYSLGNFATWYGISINGTAGLAPVLDVTLDEQGRLVRGAIRSNVQRRPEGVTPDPEQRAFRLIRELTAEDFEGGGLRFADDGSFAPER
jgi:hypothetical protein